MLNTDRIVTSLEDLACKRARTKIIVTAFSLLYFILSLLWLFYDLSDVIVFINWFPIADFLIGLVWILYPFIMLCLIMLISYMYPIPYKHPIITLKYSILAYSFILWAHIFFSLLGNDTTINMKSSLHLLLFQHISIYVIDMRLGKMNNADNAHRIDLIQQLLHESIGDKSEANDASIPEYISTVSHYIDKHL